MVRPRSNSARSVNSDDDAVNIADSTHDIINSQVDLEQPWHFWKWLIPIYSSVLCVAILLFISFWVTVASSDEFLLYIGDDNRVVWDLLPTLPVVFMIIEWPFNMIPIDWPMLIFVELLFTFYILIDFIVVSCEKNHESVYQSFDWYHEPGIAVASLVICWVVLAVIFALFWFLTNKWKLPSYEQTTREKYDRLSSLSSADRETRATRDDVSNNGA